MSQKNTTNPFYLFYSPSFSRSRLLPGLVVVLPLVIFLLLSASLAAQDGLRTLAAPKKVYIGNIISNAHLNDPANFRNGLADAHLRQEYNAVVLENYMKMSFVLPPAEPADIHNLTVEELRQTLVKDNIETFLNNEDWDGLRKRGHAMIWFNQAPDWLTLSGPTWTGQQVFDFSRKYILALGQICGDRIDEWDVINEAFSDQAPGGQGQWRQGTWYRRANDGSMTDWGEATYENYIKMLFVWAREAQPQARLYINDYAIELFNTSPASKNHFMREKVKALKACGAPIDGVGFQSHFNLSSIVSSSGELNQGFIDAVERSMEDLATAGLEVAITELDMRICGNERDEAFQEVAYQAYCEMALSQPNCHEVLIWGLRDEDSWITLANYSPFEDCQDAVIVEGDNYTPKPAYNGVAAAITALPDQDDFGFAPLAPGNGSPANCGGMGRLDPDVIAVNGPVAVSPGEQVTVAVNYLANEPHDVVVWFQLDSAPFTVYSQAITQVRAGSDTVNIDVDIPVDVPSGTAEYRYLAFITPPGEGIDSSFAQVTQNQVTVLGEDSQLIISSLGPEKVSPGDTVHVQVSYSAVEGQEIVVWFQLSQSPFTTYYEFRQTAAVGQNELTAKVYIPPSVPVADDTYQYQTLLVPTGGTWPDRISNIGQPGIDVVMTTSTTGINGNDFVIRAYPNPTTGLLTLEVPPGNRSSRLVIYSALGDVVQQQIVPAGVKQVTLQLDALPPGMFWLSVHQDAAYSTVKLFKK